VRVDRDDGRVVVVHLPGGKEVGDELLHGILGRRLAGRQFRTDKVEGSVLGGQADCSRAAVAGDLRLVSTACAICTRSALETISAPVTRSIISNVPASIRLT
jgi:hypothetical protein